MGCAGGGCLVDLEGGAAVVQEGSRLACPDPLQGLPELIGAGDPAQSAPAENRGNPPELDPSGKREDRPGHQGPQGISDHRLLPA